MKIFRNLVVLVLLCSFHPSFCFQRQIAITIDDLPFIGEEKGFHLTMIIEAAKQAQVPLTGFIIANQVQPRDLPYLKAFRDAGFNLGNHSYSHGNLQTMSKEAFINDIAHSDIILSPLLTHPKFFRFPYLADYGHNEKVNAVHQYLHSKDYIISPITTDSKDFMFNQLLLSVPEMKRRQYLHTLKESYLAFIWEQTLHAEEQLKHSNNQTQILLIHANLLNAYVLGDIIKLYKDNGFRFVSLQEALNIKNSTTN